MRRGRDATDVRQGQRADGKRVEFAGIGDNGGEELVEGRDDRLGDFGAEIAAVREDTGLKRGVG